VTPDNIAVFTFDNVAIGADVVIMAHGSRPVALLSKTFLQMTDGIIDLSGTGETLQGAGGGGGGEPSNNGAGPGGGGGSTGFTNSGGVVPALEPWEETAAVNTMEDLAVLFMEPQAWHRCRVGAEAAAVREVPEVRVAAALRSAPPATS
jgi:hypothetical protein